MSGMLKVPVLSSDGQGEPPRRATLLGSPAAAALLLVLGPTGVLLPDVVARTADVRCPVQIHQALSGPDSEDGCVAGDVIVFVTKGAAIQNGSTAPIGLICA
ncbi:hypothetical protein ACIOTI_05535 [Streptomyces sp. NPDC087843]|uniref:hypothetical protein n=1 Tax=Streptomyces sp. NPDC087843 TaxID=3365804 RepID=UPI00382525AD